MAIPSTSTTLNQNLALMVDNKIWNAVLTGPGSTVQFTLDNLKRQSPSEFARFTGTTGTIAVDLGATFSIQAGVLFLSNFTPTATVELKSATNIGFTTGVVSHGILIVGDQGVRQGCLPVLLTTPTTRQFFRWVITDSANTTGVLDVGVAYLGPIYQPSVQMSVGLQMSVVDNSQVTMGNYSGRFFDRQSRYRQLSFTLFGLSRNEVFIMLPRIFDYIGKTVPVFLSAYPLDTDPAMVREWCRYGLFSSVGQAGQPQAGLWTYEGLTLSEWSE
jgi:hypothetical protein